MDGGYRMLNQRLDMRWIEAWGESVEVVLSGATLVRRNEIDGNWECF